uniref:Integrase catalytic domain-containing protein n=1 Tax=Tanacetum cinerariifolium TaxID=118510 RepID=A0A6L2KDZ5_TANCI|nr:hypothetical protein [Tanacetum cinerariifolium]
MESLSPQVVSTAKLPILNPNEFDLWKMRIEQYFHITDYSLWEVILNGDSPIPTRVIDGVVQLVASTTAEQKLARKNELKACGTLLMALPDKHQLKFNIHKETKTLMEAIEKRFGGNKETKKMQKTLLKQQYENFTSSSSESLDQIHDRLQNLISQLEILRESLYQEDINLKLLKSLPTKWRTHTLIWRNKTDLDDQSLDDQFNSLNIYEVEVKSSSTASPTTQNIAFVSSQNTYSTNDTVSVVVSVSAASTKVPVSALPNVDTLSDAVIYSLFASQSNSPQLDNDDLKQIDDDDLEEMDLKWFDMSTVEFYNCHRRGHFARECSVMVLEAIIRAFRQKKNQQTMPSWHSPPQVLPDLIIRKSQFDVLSYQTGLESVEARIVVYQQNKTVFEKDSKLLKLDVMLRDNALVDLRKKFEKAEQETDELKLKLDKFQTSSKNLSQLLGSQTSDKTGLGYDNQVFNSIVFDCDEMFSSESNVSMPPSPVYDRYKSGEGYHAVSLPYTGTFMPPKPDLVFYDAPTVNETVPTAFNVEPSTAKRNKDLSQSNRPSTPIIKDWVSNSEYESEENGSKAYRNHAMGDRHYARMTHPNPQRHVVPTAVLTRSRLVLHNAARPVNTDVPQAKVSHQRPTKHGVNKAHLPKRRPINLRPSPPATNFHQKLLLLRLPGLMLFRVSTKNGFGNQNGNPQHALKDKGVIDSGCSRHMIVNFDDVYFVKELKFNLFSVSQMCDKKNSVLDTECIVLSSDFKLPDENHVLLRVPRENNMYNVDLKNIVPLGDLTCLFTKATLDESNLWQKRLGHINFKTMNKLVKDLNQFCRMKGIKREFSVARTPQQNGIAEKKNRTLIEAAKTMLADSLLPIPFWAEAVNIACYVQNRIPYVNLMGRLMRDFWLDTLKQPNVAGSGPTWLFDIDTLTKSMSYQPVIADNQPNSSAAPQNTNDDVTFEVKEPESEVHVSPSSSAKTKKHDDKTTREAKGKSHVELSIGVRNLSEEFEDFSSNSTNEVNAASTPVPAVEPNSSNSTNTFIAAGPYNTVVSLNFDLGGKSSYVDLSQYPDDPDMSALEDITYSDDEEDVAPQTKSMTRMVKEQGRLTQINNDDFHTCMFACFLSQEEPKRVHQALKDSSWIDVMQEELLRFKMQKPLGFKDPDSPDKVYRVVKALYGLHQATRAWYETLANYLLENSFHKGQIDQTLFIKKQKGDILLVQKHDGIFIIQDKYVAEILRKFGLTDGKSASTPIDTEKPLLMDPDGKDVDIHTYRLMIGSLMYLTLSRPDTMFAVCACAHFHVTPKASHLHAVKRIFRYLKGKPHLGLWYPKDSPFNLVAYSDSDYAGISLDRKSTTRGCQFLRCRLISWQCKN